jgi:hypothetical protein
LFFFFLLLTSTEYYYIFWVFVLLLGIKIANLINKSLSITFHFKIFLTFFFLLTFYTIAFFPIVDSVTHWETLFSCTNKIEMQGNSLLNRAARVTVISLISSCQAVEQREAQQ